MQSLITDLAKDRAYYSKPFYSRFFQYFWTRKFRFIFLGIMTGLWQKYQTGKWMANYRQRVVNKYKRRWLLRYNPTFAVSKTATETLWRPEGLSSESFERLAAKFVEYDRTIANGCSRQLVLDTLKRLSQKFADVKAQQEFIKRADHDMIRSRMLKSMSLKEYIQTVQECLQESEMTEADFVTRWIEVMAEEKEVYLARALKVIEEAEETPYEQR